MGPAAARPEPRRETRSDVLTYEPQLESQVRRHRERLALSQQELGELVGASRQAIIAIERGRTVPSTTLALRLARALRCNVEDLFSLKAEGALAVRLAPAEGHGNPPPTTARVALAEVRGRWVAHRIAADATAAADGIIAGRVSGRTTLVRPLLDLALLRTNVMIAGCAPLLGVLAHHADQSRTGVNMRWLHATTARGLDLLEAGLVHVAGVHHRDTGPDGSGNVAAVRARLPEQAFLVVNLTRWREGLVLPADNPLGIRSGADLVRPGLRFARRDEGSGAHRLLLDMMLAEGIERPTIAGPYARGHSDVASLVACGAADVGLAIEGVALAAGLTFVPLSEERFDLVVPAESANEGPVARVLAALEDPAFLADVGELPGYDTGMCGHVTTVEAA